MDDEIAALLERARAGVEGRELWRQTGPALARLRELGVSYKRIKEEIGLSPSTVAHHVRYPTGPNSPSTGEP